MKKTVIFLLVAISSQILISTEAKSDSLEKLGQRAQKGAIVLSEIIGVPERTIPESLLQKATCVATFPGVWRAGFVFGGGGGKGLASCRVAGGWSHPIFLTLGQVSWGLQIGVDSTDLILVFVRPGAINRLKESSVRLGGSASVSVGPVGRNLKAGIDYQLTAEAYSYSRSQGAFAGLTLEGAVVKVGKDDNVRAYGLSDALSILTTSGDENRGVDWPYVQALLTYVR